MRFREKRPRGASSADGDDPQAVPGVGIWNQEPRAQREEHQPSGSPFRSMTRRMRRTRPRRALPAKSPARAGTQRSPGTRPAGRSGRARRSGARCRAAHGRSITETKARPASAPSQADDRAHPPPPPAATAIPTPRSRPEFHECGERGDERGDARTEAPQHDEDARTIAIVTASLCPSAAVQIRTGFKPIAIAAARHRRGIAAGREIAQVARKPAARRSQQAERVECARTPSGAAT